MHKKPMHKRMAGLAFVLITFFASIFSFAAANTQTASSAEEKTNFLFSILEKSNTTVVQVFQQLKDKSIAAPRASIEAYNQAVFLAGESRTLLQAGNYSEASSKIVLALQKLRETLEIIYETTNLRPSGTEIFEERVVSLNSSINRSYKELNRIENLTRIAASVGFNTTTLEAKVEAVKSLLANASKSLGQKLLDAATSDIAKARTRIDELTRLLNSLSIELKIQRLETYIANTEQRLAVIKETATSLSNVASLTALNQAEISLTSAKEYLQRQLLNQTVTALISSKESEVEAVEALKPTASTATSPVGTSSSVSLSSP